MPREKARLAEQVKNLSDRLIVLEKENEQLKRASRMIEDDHQRFLNLLVASQRLSEAKNVRDILNIVNEIIINLIGSEQFGLFFHRDSQDEPLELVCEVFEENGKLTQPPVITQAMLQAAISSGRVQIADVKTGSPVAIIPLQLGPLTLGALVLYSVMPHKTQFSQTDLDLFEFLARSAARAFYSCLMEAETGVPKDLPTRLKTNLCADNRFQ